LNVEIEFHTDKCPRQLYQRDQCAAVGHERAESSIGQWSDAQPPLRTSNLQLLTNELLLQNFAPAAALTTDTGDIVYLCGKTGKYLEPAAGMASMSVFAMARAGLGGALSEAFAKAVREQSTVTLKALNMGTPEALQRVDVTVQLLNRPPGLQGMVLIVFADQREPDPGGDADLDAAVQQPSEGDARVLTLVHAMQQLREALKNTRDEMQTSQEELKSTNEELQSTNEELQSTNEELTTSREEMQSMNEELQSVNNELTAKVEEMSQASDDMKNLLNSTAIATLFLDEQMRVRRFTTQTTSIFKLIPSDVGRPITDQVTTLDYPALASDAQEVLRTLVFREVQVRGEGARWFTVRTMPYRTQDNRIDGVVITFVDISAEKSLEERLQKAAQLLAQSASSNAQAGPQSVLPDGLLQRLQSLLQAS